MEQKIEVILLGGGGGATEVVAWARSCLNENHRFKGFLSIDPQDKLKFDNTLEFLGNETTYTPQGNERFVVAIGDPTIRRKAVETLLNKNAQFLKIIHPTAVVSPTAQLGEGVVLAPFTLVSEKTVVGDFSYLNFYSSLGHDAKVGKYCFLGPYAHLNGGAKLEDEVFMAAHSMVAVNKTVGQGSKISANSAAMKDIPARSLVVGVPGDSRVIF